MSSRIFLGRVPARIETVKGILRIRVANVPNFYSEDHLTDLEKSNFRRARSNLIEDLISKLFEEPKMTHPYARPDAIYCLGHDFVWVAHGVEWCRACGAIKNIGVINYPTTIHGQLNAPIVVTNSDHT